MSPSRITESIVEQVALDWLAGAGWQALAGASLTARTCLRVTHRQASGRVPPIRSGPTMGKCEAEKVGLVK